MPSTVSYHFSQRFVVSAQKAFEWCTDFDPNDHALMADSGAERQIKRIDDRTIMLKDTFHANGEKIEKKKLVELYPAQLMWTSTHLTGPNKYSQFHYQITSEDKDCSVLDFIGLHLDYKCKENAELLADRLCKEDANAWKLLAKAMAKDIGKQKQRLLSS